ncbi:hypothetical protein NLM24_00940 [Nocardia zapadnayensis]|uniref:hypothetical protein n=1 Tax=Nocardia rhamnosiphila TaxID=426716 RepID=UPI0022454447|nr:hypothetical protein [Nocardia zapadnayensis]MCX0269302.1 hypothetical protein [Nocardia zapadnayensis]
MNHHIAEMIEDPHGPIGYRRPPVLGHQLVLSAASSSDILDLAVPVVVREGERNMVPADLADEKTSNAAAQATPEHSEPHAPDRAGRACPAISGGYAKSGAKEDRAACCGISLARMQQIHCPKGHFVTERRTRENEKSSKTTSGGPQLWAP